MVTICVYTANLVPWTPDYRPSPDNDSPIECESIVILKDVEKDLPKRKT